MTPRRPILRYRGGKWRDGPWIISHFPGHRVYHEPYCGGASVLARKPRSFSEIINDLSGDVVNVFWVLRHPARARELERLLRLTPFAEAEFKAAYLPADDPVERARRTITRAHLGHGANGVNRNRKTGFRGRAHRRTTTGAQDWVNLPDQIRDWVARLQGVVITNRDALESLARHDEPDCLHYVDPPYMDSTRYQEAKRDYEHPMTDDQHRELAEVLHGLEGMVILSGYPSEAYDRWYQDWTRVERRSLADRGKIATEVLWLNPAAAKAMPQPGLFDREEAA